jgi:hypothetical protein
VAWEKIIPGGSLPPTYNNGVRNTRLLSGSVLAFCSNDKKHFPQRYRTYFRRQCEDWLPQLHGFQLCFGYSRPSNQHNTFHTLLEFDSLALKKQALNGKISSLDVDYPTKTGRVRTADCQENRLLVIVFQPLSNKREFTPH